MHNTSKSLNLDRYCYKTKVNTALGSSKRHFIHCTLWIGNLPVLPINRDIFFDNNNRYRPIFTVNNNRKEQ